MKRIVLVAVVATFLGCTSNTDRGPLAPSSSGVNLVQQLSWGCLTDPESCGMAASTISTSPSPIVGPANFAAVVNGSTVTLNWQPPPGVASSGYLLEAGTAPGLNNIVIFVLLSQATTLTVNGVPAGTYFARIRGIAGSIATDPSNEVVVNVGGPPGGCAPTVSPTNLRAPAGGGTVTLNVLATCAWTAQSHSAFMTIASGASGFGNGTITLSFAANPGSTRQGVLTINNGEAVLITQDSGQIAVAFELYDPDAQTTATTECRFRSAATKCELRSTSFPRGGNVLTSYTWSLQYTYGTVKTMSVTNSTGRLEFTDACGGPTSAAEGPSQPLSVTLTVTDNNGATASATAGSGSQPALFVRLFTCG